MGGPVSSDLTTARRRSDGAGEPDEPVVARPLPTDAARAVLRSYATLRVEAFAAEATRHAIEAAQLARLPPLGDLSLYTPELLEREIAASRARKGTPAELELCGALERELVRRSEPKSEDPRSYETREALDVAIRTEKEFLARYGSLASSEVRRAHERHVEALRLRREEVLLLARACDGAQPSYVDARALPRGAREIALGADDFVTAIRARTPLSGKEEAAVRAAFATWRGQQCLRTGQDPTRLARADRYAEVREDRSAERDAVAQKYLEMIDAMRGSALAALAFVDSAVRRDDVDATLQRVRAAAALGEVIASVAQARPMLHPSAAHDGRAEHRESDGLARRLVDDRHAAGHAMSTRFRGVDNSAFEKDPRLVTYGPYRKNAGGAVRTVEEARGIFERQTGRKMPDWVKIVVDRSLPADRDAMYVIREGVQLREKVNASDFKSGIVVRVRPQVFESDESIVAHLAHETWELEALHRKLVVSGELSAAEIRSLVEPRRPQVVGGAERAENLHGQAWDVADLEVLLMRSRPGSPEHGRLLTARERLRARFDEQNHGD